ncbi:hypothetical protein ABG067_001306 [Albugo candida]
MNQKSNLIMEDLIDLISPSMEQSMDDDKAQDAIAYDPKHQITAPPIPIKVNLDCNNLDLSHEEITDRAAVDESDKSDSTLSSETITKEPSSSNIAATSHNNDDERSVTQQIKDLKIASSQKVESFDQAEEECTQQNKLPTDQQAVLKSKYKRKQGEARSKSKNERSESTTNQARYENLYRDAQLKEEKRQEKRKELQEKEDESYSFRPKINATKYRSKQPRSLYDAEREKEKKKMMEQKRIDAEVRNCTFQPTVKRKSSKGNRSVDGSKTDPFDRLYQTAYAKRSMMEKLKKNEEERFESQLTRPRVKRATKKSSDQKPFHERLYSKDYKQKLVADREQRKMQKESEFTFKPRISSGAEELRNREKDEPNAKSIFQRLYEEKDRIKEKQELGEELKMRKQLEACTFRPLIDGDKAMHASTESNKPVWERLLSVDKNIIIEEREKLKEKIELKECTFRPNITPPKSSCREALKPGERSVEKKSAEKLAVILERDSRLSKSGDLKQNAAIKDVANAGSNRSISVRDIVKSSALLLGEESSAIRKDNLPRNESSQPDSQQEVQSLSDTQASHEKNAHSEGNGVNTDQDVQRSTATEAEVADMTRPVSAVDAFQHWTEQMQADLKDNLHANDS